MNDLVWVTVILIFLHFSLAHLYVRKIHHLLKYTNFFGWSKRRIPWYPV